MSSRSVGGAPRRLVGRMKALRKNREAERSELRNCQPRTQALRLEQEAGWTERKRGRLEGKGLGRKQQKRNRSLCLQQSKGRLDRGHRQDYGSQELQIEPRRGENVKRNVHPEKGRE